MALAMAMAMAMALALAMANSCYIELINVVGSNMKINQRNKIKEQILERIDFLSEHWTMNDNNKPFQFGGWREEVAEGIVDILDQARAEAVEEAREEGWRQGYKQAKEDIPDKEEI